MTTSTEKLFGTATFEVTIPLSNYEDKGTLAKKYASRDTKMAIELAKEKIRGLGLKRIPLSVEIKAFFKSQTTSSTTFTIHVSGANEKFLLALIDTL